MKVGYKKIKPQKMKTMKTNKKRKPTSPGKILREEFLTPLGLSQKQLAERIGCDRKAPSERIWKMSDKAKPEVIENLELFEE